MYSKEQVVELFGELRDKGLGAGYVCTNKFDNFLREKGLIKPVLEVGKWYKDDCDEFDRLFYVESLSATGEVFGYGFSGTEWLDNNTITWGVKGYQIIEATREEVKTALIAEAKRRGFKEGVKFVNLDNDIAVHLDNIHFGEHYDFGFYLYSDYGIGYIFKNGKWATIIEDNKELDELKATYKELGRKIDELENK